MISRLAALARDDRAELGSRDGDDRLRLSALAVSNGIADCAGFVKHFPRSRLPVELRAASPFVVQSTGEGSGIALLEALACGIGQDRDGSRDALGDGNPGIFTFQRLRIDANDSALACSVDPCAIAARAPARYFPRRFGAHASALAPESLMSRSPVA